jgi:hypothetical protein
MTRQASFSSPFLEEVEQDTPKLSNLSEYFSLEALSPFAQESPFQNESRRGVSYQDPETAVVAEMLYEVSDPDFRDATRRFTQEIFELYVREGGDPEGSQEMEAAVEDGVLRQLQPGIRGYEAAMDAVYRELGAKDAAELEMEEVARAFRQATGNVNSDQFEYFFGGLLKKAGKMVRGVVRGAKKLAGKALGAIKKVLPIGPILEKLKGLVKPLIKRVLKAALGHVPEKFRPAAQKLANVFLGDLAPKLNGPESERGAAEQDPAQAEADMNEYLMGEVFSGEATQEELGGRRAHPFLHPQFRNRLRRLRKARRDFAAMMQRLPRARGARALAGTAAEPATSEPTDDQAAGQDADPAADPATAAVAQNLEEQLIPAIIAAAPVALGVAKVAIGVIGARQRREDAVQARGATDSALHRQGSGATAGRLYR